jgi:hypothetical protein
MTKTITKWLVEEVDSKTNKKLFSVEFSDYAEAMETYNHLKEVTSKNLVIIHKQNKRLLVE